MSKISLKFPREQWVKVPNLPLVPCYFDVICNQASVSCPPPAGPTDKLCKLCERLAILIMSYIAWHWAVGIPDTGVRAHRIDQELSTYSKNKIQTLHNTEILLQNTHKKHSIFCPWAHRIDQKLSTYSKNKIETLYNTNILQNTHKKYSICRPWAHKIDQKLSTYSKNKIETLYNTNILQNTHKKYSICRPWAHKIDQKLSTYSKNKLKLFITQKFFSKILTKYIPYLAHEGEERRVLTQFIIRGKSIQNKWQIIHFLCK